jgi:opacity protein-like surface antigen
MRHVLALRRWGIGIVAAIVVISVPRQAGAQGFISPFVGYNFSGDSGCPEITNCEDKHANYGLAFGALGGLVGFEGEVAHTSDFFGDSPQQTTSVLTFTGSFMLSPRFGPLQPYGLAGLGLMRTSIESAGQNEDDNQFGYNLGGGLIAFFGAHVGVRGDIRYFHAFEVLDLSKFPSLQARNTKLDFGRFSVAMVFKF